MSSNPILQINAAQWLIKSVTVFKSSKAEVVRTFTVDLKAGHNTVEIRALPSTIDADSIRVSGLGDARLLDVVCTSENDSTYDQNDITHALEIKKSIVEAEKRVLDHQANLLVGYGKTLSGEHITPSAMIQFMENFVEQGRKNAVAVSVLDEKILDIDRQINEEISKKSLKKGETKRRITVIIAVEESGPVELKLTYIVSQASWRPTYELHATTENGKPSSSVSLHYRARISQSTGEDWTNTALTLSTVASGIVAKNIPILWPRNLKVQRFNSQNTGFRVAAGGTTQNASFEHKAPFGPSTSLFSQQSVPTFGQSISGFGQASSVFGQQTGGLFGSTSQPPAPSMFGGGQFGGVSSSAPANDQIDAPHAVGEKHPEGDEPSFEEVVVPGPFSEPTTIVRESPLATSYSVEGKSTIPSDGEAHQVSVAVLPFEAKVMHVAVPRIEPLVYLQCKVKNTSDYSLLPGLVTVVLDDGFVSRTSIQDINKGDTFNCTLGVDSATKLSYLRNCRTAPAITGAFAEGSNITTDTTRIAVHNTHAFAIDLAVHDVIPICDDKRVKVILRKPEGLADAKDGEIVDLKNNGMKVSWEKVVDGKGGEKDGKYVWSWVLDAGLKVKLEAEWEIKTPVDTVWVEANPFAQVHKFT